MANTPSSSETLPLDTNNQHRILRQRVEAYRAARAQAEISRKAYVEAQESWKNDLARCEEIESVLAKYVDKKRPQVVVTLDGGNIACLIKRVDTYGLGIIGAHVSFLPVSGYPPGPPVEPREVHLEDLPDHHRYEHAGKLGPWARNDKPTRECWPDRYLAVGSQNKPTYKRIIDVERGPEGWRYISVLLEGSEEPTLHGCNTNTYVRR